MNQNENACLFAMTLFCSPYFAIPRFPFSGNDAGGSPISRCSYLDYFGVLGIFGLYMSSKYYTKGVGYVSGNPGRHVYCIDLHAYLMPITHNP
ncbi:hypothetical protein F4811DRAFT_513058 [Daldinia bambusicola]|nr:hypothetical protein F4811DRAFT_513058 [Daldinia bambusicola]